MAHRDDSDDQPLLIDIAADVPTQRWRERSNSWVRTSDGGFDPQRYEVRPLDQSEAAAFVRTHHYSQVYPQSDSVNRFGLYDRGTKGKPLVGVSVLGNPVGHRVLPAAFPRLIPYKQSLELTRFVLLDEVPANGETWFLGQTFDRAREAGIRGVLAFSDPNQHIDEAGKILSLGHTGHIYWSSNGIFTGTCEKSHVFVLPDQSALHPRSLQKVRRRESGYQGVVRRLVALGATPLRDGSDGGRWIQDALQDVGAVRHDTHGKLRYLFQVGADRVRRKMTDDQRAELAIGHRRVDTKPTLPQVLLPVTPSVPRSANAKATTLALF